MPTINTQLFRNIRFMCFYPPDTIELETINPHNNTCHIITLTGIAHFILTMHSNPLVTNNNQELIAFDFPEFVTVKKINKFLFFYHHTSARLKS